MDSNVILNKYWDIFLGHICEFYPLEKGFITEWEYELDWHALSKNRKLEWSDAFLEQYQERFVWHEVAWNDAIVWDIPKIEKFKKRLDWYYLQQNVNLVLSEALIEKYRKKLSYVVDSNLFLTDTLKEKYTLSVYPDRKYGTRPKEPLPEGDLEEYIENLSKGNNELELYQKLFLPVVEESSIEAIFNAKFDYSQRYFYLEPKRNDIHGLTPEFESVKEVKNFTEFINGQSVGALGEEITLKNGSLQEGPDRLLEVPRFYLQGVYNDAILLVSENIKALLEKFSLPEERIFHQVKMQHRKIKSDTKYYIFQAAGNTILKELDFEKCNFRFRSLYTKDESAVDGPLGYKLKNFEHLVETEKELRAKYDCYIEVRPDEYLLRTEKDMYTDPDGRKIIINDFLKHALEKAFPDQMYFRSAQLVPVKIDQEKYDNKAGLNLADNISSKPIYIPSEADLFFQAKMKRLENSKEAVTPEMTKNDVFSAKELELNVLFPEEFKEKILAKRLKIRGYKMLKPAGYYIENEYTSRTPESYNSVVIAENGLGDTINLFLEKDSDFKLKDEYYEFLHETGEVKKLGLGRYKM
ncbi:MAG: hypothetical protein EOO45_07900 [Flavobacterium sp.]|nr:MAG: hypothetical protein EOO45_07900 [Flavobacterium sp.]